MLLNSFTASPVVVESPDKNITRSKNTWKNVERTESCIMSALSRLHAVNLLHVKLVKFALQHSHLFLCPGLPRRVYPAVRGGRCCQSDVFVLSV